MPISLAFRESPILPAMDDFLSSALVTLLVTVDPPGLAPLFISLTHGMVAGERRQVALRAALIAFAVLTFFALGGGRILTLLGVGLSAFRIAGGFLLFWIAFEMVFEAPSERKAETARSAITIDHIRNIAAFALAIPLQAGPGAITATILLAGRAGLRDLAAESLHFVETAGDIAHGRHAGYPRPARRGGRVTVNSTDTRRPSRVRAGTDKRSPSP
jgi:multiple antibiotic resistance protein